MGEFPWLLAAESTTTAARTQGRPLREICDSSGSGVFLKSHGCNDSRVEIVHSTQVVEMHDSGIDAVSFSNVVTKGDPVVVIVAGLVIAAKYCVGTHYDGARGQIRASGVA